MSETGLGFRKVASRRYPAEPTSVTEPAGVVVATIALEAVMQPCQVCGGMAVDAAGYCTQCGTFRGAPQPGGYPGQPGYPGGQPGYPPQPAGYGGQPGGYADPTYGAPYPGAPVSAQPASGPTYQYQQPAPTSQYQPGPVSSPPGYMGQMSAPPMSGPPGYPAYPVSAPPPPKKSMMVPFLVGGIAVVLLIASIIVVLVVKSGKGGGGVADPTHGPSSTGTPTPTRSSVIDSCLVGKWQVTSEQLTVDFGSTYGEVDLTLVDKYTIVFNADGTATENYGTQVEFDATTSGHSFSWLQSGTLDYDLRTSGGKMTFSASVPKGQYAAYVDSSKIDSGTNTFSYNNMSYTCAGDSMSREASNSSRTIDSMRMTRLKG